MALGDHGGPLKPVRFPVAFRVHTTHTALFYPSSIVSLLVHQSLVNQNTIHLIYHLFSAGAALLLYSDGACAAPAARTSSISYIEKYAGCDASQVQKLEQAFADVHTLVTLAETIDTSKHPWSNYFRKQGDGKTEDGKHIKAMWKAIASPNFKITVTCTTSDNAACKHGRSASKASEPPSKFCKGIED
ncbi:hypothetical protein AnigIFM50267_010799 [Aspergillus niger]|nr:hypothetical protein AnigIFM50267_010799 [Aspergillus niger]